MKRPSDDVTRVAIARKKVLVVRTDNLGDLILTAPLNRWLSENYLLDVFWMVDARFAYVLEQGGVKSDHILSVQRANGFIGRLKSVREISRSIKLLGFAGACICYSAWPVAVALFLARVPVRVGVFSKWWGFVFYTFPVRQRRSQAVQHESEYNFDIAQEFVCELAAKINRGNGFEHVPDGSGTLDFFKLTAPKTLDFKSLPKDFVVIHPGMAGSARNWSARNYFSLVQKVIASQVAVVLTGTDSDRPFLAECGLEKIPGVISLVGKTSGGQILEVLSLAKAVVAPSTGVLHLAASLGVPAIGIYSPVQVQHPKRWGPRGPKADVIFPSQIDCPGVLRCIGESCPHFDCMDTILVDKVFGRLTNVMGNQ